MKPAKSETTPTQRLAEILASECPDEAIGQVLRDCLGATIVTRSGAVQADSKTRLECARLVLGYYRHVIQNQAIATLLCELHRVNVGESITLTAARILEITTQGAFSFLGSERRKKMELLLKVNVFNKIAEHWKSRSPDAVKVQGKELTVTFQSDGIQSDFLDWLERSKAVFGDEAPSGPDIEQMDLPLE